MHINMIGYNFAHQKEFILGRPKGSGDWLVLFVITPALFIINGEQVFVEKNTLIVYNKGTPQHYRATEEIFINHWFHFDLDEETDFLKELQIPVDTLIGGINPDTISSAIYEMSCEFNAHRLHSERLTQLQVKGFFLKLSQMLQDQNELKTTHRYYETFNEIRQEIYNEPYQCFEVYKFAQKLGLSLSHFQHTYKAVFGVACLTDVIQSKMNYAKYNLVKNDYKISHIAEMCGYENDVHFMRLFKKYEGMTPSAYRKLYHQTLSQ